MRRSRHTQPRGIRRAAWRNAKENRLRLSQTALTGEAASARSGATEQRSLRIAPIASHATARHSPRCVENRKRKPPAFVADGFGRGDASARSEATEQRSLRIAPIASHATARHSPRCVENRKRKPPAFIADGFGRGDAKLTTTKYSYQTSIKNTISCGFLNLVTI